MIKSGFRIDFTRHNPEQLFSCLIGVFGVFVPNYLRNLLFFFILFRENISTLFNMKKKIRSYFLLGISILVLVSCENRRLKEFNNAQEFLAKGEFRIATSLFEKIVQKDGISDLSIKSVRELAKIYLYEFKDYDKAIDRLRFIILYSKDAKERFKSQKQIAQIFFDYKAQYENAVLEFSRLLSMPLSKTENFEIRLSIARAYYHLGNFEQSWREVIALNINAGASENSNYNYDIELLQANIKMAQKDHSSAARMYEDLLKNHPIRANKENIPLNLSLCYEVEENFEEAIEILKPLIEFYKPAEFIKLKIKKLSERQQNKPKKRVKK
jgi:tetratricopeptide (TPR) repeat protein